MLATGRRGMELTVVGSGTRGGLQRRSHGTSNRCQKWQRLGDGALIWKAGARRDWDARKWGSVEVCCTLNGRRWVVSWTGEEKVQPTLCSDPKILPIALALRLRWCGIPDVQATEEAHVHHSHALQSRTAAMRVAAHCSSAARRLWQALVAELLLSTFRAGTKVLHNVDLLEDQESHSHRSLSSWLCWWKRQRGKTASTLRTSQRYWMGPTLGTCWIAQYVWTTSQPGILAALSVVAFSAARQELVLTLFERVAVDVAGTDETSYSIAGSSVLRPEKCLDLSARPEDDSQFHYFV